VVLIQIIMIYAFRVLEGIVYKITEDFDGTNELLSDAINFFFISFFASVIFFTPFQLLRWCLVMGKSCRYHLKIIYFV
jgi:hypothetical protein